MKPRSATHLSLCLRGTSGLRHRNINLWCCAFPETTDALICLGKTFTDSGIQCIANQTAEKRESKDNVTQSEYFSEYASQQWKSCRQACSHCSHLIDRNMSVSTSQHLTNIQNLRAAKILSPLISQPTSQTRKRPDNPQPKAKGKQESTPSTAESKQGRGEIYISQRRPGTQGLAKVNNSTSRPIIDGTVPFYTVNRCQTVVEPSHQITKDLQHPRITEECLALILHHLVLDSL